MGLGGWARSGKKRGPGERRCSNTLWLEDVGSRDVLGGGMEAGSLPPEGSFPSLTMLLSNRLRDQLSLVGELRPFSELFPPPPGICESRSLVGSLGGRRARVTFPGLLEGQRQNRTRSPKPWFGVLGKCRDAVLPDSEAEILPVSRVVGIGQMDGRRSELRSAVFLIAN